MEQALDVVIVGAGQAGLALGYELRRENLDFAILDGEKRVGDCWRRYWDSLRLFSPARFNNLPGMPFPGEPDRFPHKDEVADYLEAYATRFELPVRLCSRVERVQKKAGWFVFETARGPLASRVAVAATGSHSRSAIPPLARELDPGILQLTATSYRNPEQLPEGAVLVVGAGNSGVQIAMEVCKTRPTILAGPDPGRIPRRVLHRDVFDWIQLFDLFGRDVDSHLGRRLVAWVQGRGDPVIGTSAREIRAAGIKRVPRVVGHERGRPELASGEVVHVGSVIWCCGIQPDFSWIGGLSTDPSDQPRHARGQSMDVDSLFFMGLRFQNRLGSGLLGGVGRDAREICETITAKLAGG